jgi:hypothetical protein
VSSPGDSEDRQGKPFVGPAGRPLDAALGDAGIPRERAYLTNAVRPAPGRQRDGGRLAVAGFTLAWFTSAWRVNRCYDPHTPASPGLLKTAGPRSPLRTGSATRSPAGTSKAADPVHLTPRRRRQLCAASAALRRPAGGLGPAIPLDAGQQRHDVRQAEEGTRSDQAGGAGGSAAAAAAAASTAVLRCSRCRTRPVDWYHWVMMMTARATSTAVPP